MSTPNDTSSTGVGNVTTQMGNSRSDGILEPTWPEYNGTPGTGTSDPGNFNRPDLIGTGVGGFNNEDLRQWAAYFLNQSLTGAQQPFTEVGGAEGVVNVNQNNTQSVLNRIFSGLQQPNNAQRQTDSALSQLLGGQLPAFMTSIANRAAQATGNIYSGSNALYSGAAQTNIGRATTQAVGEQTNQYLSSLLGASTSYAGTEASRQTGLLGQAAGLAMPEYYNPTYAQNPNYLSIPQAWSLDKTNTMAPIAAISSGGSAIMQAIAAIIGAGA